MVLCDRRIEIDEDRILAAFHLLDHNGTGLLDTESIRRVLGVDASEENINQIVSIDMFLCMMCVTEYSLLYMICVYR